MATPRKRTPKTIEADDVFPPETTRQLPQYTEPAPQPFYIPDDYDDITALNTVLSELGATESESNGFIMVYRETITGNNKVEKYLARYNVSEYANGNLLDTLQNTYGGGRYHIRVYRANGAGIAANRWIDIADNPNVTPLVPAANIAPAASPVDLTPLVTMMQQGFEKIFVAMTQAQQKPQTRAEMLDEMRIMREMFTPPVQNTPTVPQYNPVDMMKLGMEMAQMGGGDNNNAWIAKMIDTFGKPIVDQVIASQAAKTIPQRTLPQPVVSPATPALPTTTPITDESEDAVNIMIKGYLKLLTGAASSNHPVEDYADGILNFIPASELPDFDAMLRAADWRDRFAQYSPAVLQYPQWFENLRNTLIAYIDEDRAANGNLTTSLSGASVAGHEDAYTGQGTNTDNPVVTS